LSVGGWVTSGIVQPFQFWAADSSKATWDTCRKLQKICAGPRNNELVRYAHFFQDFKFHLVIDVSICWRRSSSGIVKSLAKRL
jgi:hypothetical protein